MRQFLAAPLRLSTNLQSFKRLYRTSSNMLNKDLNKLLEKYKLQVDKGVVVFSKSYCPYCEKAKKTIKLYFKSGDIAEYELDQMNDGYQIQEKLKKLTNQRTVPNIFINGEHIGGNSDLQKKSKVELEKMAANLDRN